MENQSCVIHPNVISQTFWETFSSVAFMFWILFPVAYLQLHTFLVFFVDVVVVSFPFLRDTRLPITSAYPLICSMPSHVSDSFSVYRKTAGEFQAVGLI